ncbi:protein that induces appearance of [PIN+] prion when overproduced [Recurvomyces mirabilis]|nr:protein that induces appearance of [PIN+] prion when overproduced [Recurvomyces mirabilis]
MEGFNEFKVAQTNKSIRTIKAELEYLCDASIISPLQLNELLSRIPEQTALHAPLSVGAVPTNGMTNLSLQNQNNNQQRNNTVTSPLNEKSSFYAPVQSPPPQQNNQPPAYDQPPPGPPPPQANWAATPPLAQATALYAYTSTDAGDLALQPNDHITVTEYMNAEWWKGKSTRTGQEGIFPRSYVKVDESEKAGTATAPVNYGNNYGNAPLEVSGQGNGEGKAPSKVQEGGKKFGKKLGNAAIFGAGATIGSNIVNGIF